MTKTLQNIKLILIDIDGTFIDSHKSILSQHIKIAKLLNLRVPTEKEIRDKLSIPWHSLLKELWPDVDVKKFQDKYMEEPRDYNLEPFKGVIKFTEELKKHYQVGIVTGKSMTGVKNNFKDLNIPLDGYVVIKTGDMKTTKPNPKVFTNILEELNLPAEQVLYLGDTILDLECAYGAKIHFAGVLTGGVKESAFKEAGAKIILNALTDLPSIIDIKN